MIKWCFRDDLLSHRIHLITELHSFPLKHDFVQTNASPFVGHLVGSWSRFDVLGDDILLSGVQIFDSGECTLRRTAPIRMEFLHRLVGAGLRHWLCR